MRCPPPGQTMTAAPVSLSFSGRKMAIVGLLTFVSLMIFRSPTGLSVGLLMSVSGGSSLVSPGGFPGHRSITVGSAADTAPLRDNTNKQAVTRFIEGALGWKGLCIRMLAVREPR